MFYSADGLPGDDGSSGSFASPSTSSASRSQLSAILKRWSRFSRSVVRLPKSRQCLACFRYSSALLMGVRVSMRCPIRPTPGGCDCPGPAVHGLVISFAPSGQWKAPPVRGCTDGANSYRCASSLGGGGEERDPPFNQRKSPACGFSLALPPPAAKLASCYVGPCITPKLTASLLPATSRRGTGASPASVT